jgi:hypothetical protein
MGTSQSFGSNPALAAGRDGNVWVGMIKPADNSIWFSRRDVGTGQWASWSRLGNASSFGHEPVVTVNGNGDVFVVIRGTDDRPYWMARWSNTGAWSPWSLLGSPASRGFEPSLVNATNGVRAFIRGTDDGIWTSLWTGTGWMTWDRIGVAHEKAGSGVGPHATVDRAGIVHVAIAGTDSGIYTNTLAPAQAWTGWRRIGGSGDRVGSQAETAVVGAPNGMVVSLIRGTDQLIYAAIRS